MYVKLSWGVGLVSLMVLACSGAAADEAKAGAAKSPAAAIEGDSAAPSKAEPQTSESKTKASKSVPDPFALPKDATPEKLIKFVHDLSELDPILLTQEAAVEHFSKVSTAILLATDKVLTTAGVDERLAAQALDARFAALSLKAKLGDQTAGKQRLELGKKYSQDPRRLLAKIAREDLLFANLDAFDELQQEEEVQLLENVVAMLKSIRTLDNKSIRLIMTIGRIFEGAKTVDLGARAYDEFALAVAHLPDPQAAALAKQIERMAKRMRLVGQPIEIAGQLTTNQPIDWASYRGKVVLIDFWATWCQPCIMELPNLKSIYQGYASKGFDIVGVSKDTEKETLDRFLAKNEIAWGNLFNFDQGAEDHPLAEKYGILTIPYTILVGKDGKVIKMNPTSKELREQLTKLLGAPDEAGKKVEAK